MAERNEAEALRFVVVFLRYYCNKTQAEFGKASQIDQSYISRYELGKQTPTAETLRRMAAAAGVPWHVVVQLRRFCASAFSVAARQEEVISKVVAPFDRSVLDRALLGVAPYFVEVATTDTTPPSPEEERLEAEKVWAALEHFPVHRRRRLVELSLRASRSWALTVRIAEASVGVAAHRADEALTLADLALFIAGRVPGEEGWRSRLQGYVWAHVANARRVANDFDGADEAFTRAWELWRAGIDSDHLLPEWRLLDLEASLRRAQHRFPETLALLNRAGALCGDDKTAAGRILLQKEHVLSRMGDFEGALAVLDEAAPLLEHSGEPRIRAVFWFNRADTLYHLGRYTEAAELLPQVRKLVRQQAQELDLLRVLWLEARIMAGLGKIREATVALEQVQREFITAHDLPYDAALSSLDLAVLWLEEGRTTKVRELALGMAWIFASKKIDREALAALRLFYEAARQERATVELARRVLARIKEVSRSA